LTLHCCWHCDAGVARQPHCQGPVYQFWHCTVAGTVMQVWQGNHHCQGPVYQFWHCTVAGTVMQVWQGNPTVKGQCTSFDIALLLAFVWLPEHYCVLCTKIGDMLVEVCQLIIMWLSVKHWQRMVDLSGTAVSSVTRYSAPVHLILCMCSVSGKFTVVESLQRLW